MKIYDAFIFNNELELLELRLNYLDNSVDYFIIGESRQTFSGGSKPLYFAENKERFSRFLPKIIHLEIPHLETSIWEREYFQREFLKQGLQSADDNDLLILSDADEIINLPELKSQILKFESPILIRTAVYYYWFNLKSNIPWTYQLAARCRNVMEMTIGNRDLFETKNYPVIDLSPGKVNGWHFSYLFGMDIKKYQTKIQAFSHHEFNNSHFLNTRRIQNCVRMGIDLFERPKINFRFDLKGIEPLIPLIKKLKLNHLIADNSVQGWSVSDFLFLVKHKFLNKILRQFRHYSLRLNYHVSKYRKK